MAPPPTQLTFIRGQRMTAEPSVLVGGGGEMFPTPPPANYQAGSLNSKQPVLTLAGEICSFIPR